MGIAVFRGCNGTQIRIRRHIVDDMAVFSAAKHRSVHLSVAFNMYEGLKHIGEIVEIRMRLATTSAEHMAIVISLGTNLGIACDGHISTSKVCRRENGSIVIGQHFLNTHRSHTTAAIHRAVHLTIVNQHMSAHTRITSRRAIFRLAVFDVCAVTTATTIDIAIHTGKTFTTNRHLATIHGFIVDDSVADGHMGHA